MRTGIKMMNLYENIDGFWKKHKYVLSVILFYSLFHIFIQPDYWDDATFGKALQTFHYDLFGYTSYRYHAGSSRIFIEMCLSIIAALPSVIWKLLDLLMIALLYRELDRFAEHSLSISGKNRQFVLALLLCAFPFSSMASAGWIATTTNYLWVLSLGMYVINSIIKVAFHDKVLSGREKILLIPATLYSASHEVMAGILFLVLVAAIIYIRWVKHDKVPIILWAILLIIMSLLVYIGLCPGNRRRILSDTENWMPEYFQLNLLDKIRMGMVTAFLHFVSIPNAIFFLISCLGALGTIYHTRTIYKRFIACIPAGVDIIWSCYFLVSYFTGENNMTYQSVSPLLGGTDTLEQAMLLGSLALWLGGMICAMFWSIPQRKTFWLGMLLLGVGCIPELIVGLTPTVVASMLRTVIYLYLAMILVIMIMWENLSEKMSKNRSVLIFVYMVIGAGILLNVMQIVRHILVYG